jgi:hypothetical protein
MQASDTLLLLAYYFFTCVQKISEPPEISPSEPPKGLIEVLGESGERDQEEGGTKKSAELFLKYFPACALLIEELSKV